MELGRVVFLASGENHGATQYLTEADGTEL